MTITVANCDDTRAILTRRVPRFSEHASSITSTRAVVSCADLAGLSFIDTAGLEIVADAHRTFLDRRGTLILTGLSTRTRRVVQIVGFDSLLLTGADIAHTAVRLA